MTKTLGGYGLRIIPKRLLPQYCSWQPKKRVLVQKKNLEGDPIKVVDWELGPPCGKKAYWMMGYLFEARFYCKKHGQILYNRVHRYDKGTKDAVHSKKEGKQVRSGEHPDKPSKGNTPKQSSSGETEETARGN